MSTPKRISRATDRSGLDSHQAQTARLPVSKPDDLAPPNDSIVPDHVVPAGQLPPLQYRDMPEPVSLRKMVGPGVILAGLALGSGEFILWPYITYQSAFVFFWACVLGVVTQYFINMEITRWSLATGESADGRS